MFCYSFACYEIEHMASKQKSLDFFFRKKSENSVEDDVKFVLNNVIKKAVASEDNNLRKIRKITSIRKLRTVICLSNH